LASSFIFFRRYRIIDAATIGRRRAVSDVMAESDEKEKHSTKAVTDEPQEEFIEPQAQPSIPKEKADAKSPNDKD
jgi:hypothetical protein